MIENTDFLIIDTYNMISRSKSNWTKGDGNLMLFSFLRTLHKVINDFPSQKVIMPLDDYIGNSFRRQLLPTYKIHRVSRNEADPFNGEFKKQKEMILYLLESVFPVYTLKYKGYEADDLIAMICQLVEDNTRIIVWSNDNDLIQLQQKFKNVKVWDPQNKRFFPTPPYDIVMYKSILGDVSDNISGIKGIGKKNIHKILNSRFEFIKMISSQPEKYIKYRDNKKLIDLLDNDLAIPDNLFFILNKKVKYIQKEFEKMITENHYNEIIKNINSYNQIFLQLQMNSMCQLPPILRDK